jgi:hypothetical protein
VPAKVFLGLMLVAWMVGALATGVPAAAAPTVIDFEDAPVGSLTTFYKAHGLTFEDARVVDYAGRLSSVTPRFARSGSKAVLPNCGSDDTCNDSITVLFDQGEVEVSMYVGVTDSVSEPSVLGLRAYSDEDGKQLLVEDAVAVEPTSQRTPVSLPLNVTSASGAIKRVDIEWVKRSTRDSGFLAVDDVVFDPIAPLLEAAPKSLDFGPTPRGQTTTPQIVTVRNGGNVPITLEGAEASQNFVLDDRCGSRTLVPNEQCSVIVSFAPKATGRLDAILSFSGSAAARVPTVQLFGEGVPAIATTTTTTEPTTTTSRPPPLPPPTPDPPGNGFDLLTTVLFAVLGVAVLGLLAVATTLWKTRPRPIGPGVDVSWAPGTTKHVFEPRGGFTISIHLDPTSGEMRWTEGSPG